jgi:hypothetical protein
MRKLIVIDFQISVSLMSDRRQERAPVGAYEGGIFWKLRLLPLV